MWKSAVLTPIASNAYNARNVPTRLYLWVKTCETRRESFIIGIAGRYARARLAVILFPG